MIPIAKPFLGVEEQRAVLDVLASGMLAQGPRVKEFEDKFAEYIGVRHAIATSNGTTALHTALLASGIKPGDEVITTPFTFFATASSILHCGAKPKFVDIDESYNINPALISEAITAKTMAIMPVHLYGNPCDMKAITEIADDHNIQIIEDACQAHGAEHNGKKVGSFGTGCFSFYPTKNMTTGEGGIITTDSNEICRRARLLRDHGSEEKYYHQVLGFNHRMTDIAAAIGIEQLKKLDIFSTRRINNAMHLNKKLANMVITPRVKENTRHVFHQYTIRVKNRDEVASRLREKGIGTSVFYPLSVHRQEALKSYSGQSYPVAEAVAGEALSLPVHPLVSRSDLDIIIDALKEIL
ncbi:MAG: DegT/DnrJ/EryC1/StrS family aminotransferase [archaeon]